MMQPVGDFSPATLVRLLGGRKERKKMDTTQKPGFKTTEFWLSLLATLIGALLASGVLHSDDPTQAKVLQIVGVVAALLASMGYTAGRSFVKATDSKASAIAAAAMSSAPALTPPSDPK